MKYRVSYVIEAGNIERAITDLVYPVIIGALGLDVVRDMSAITSVEVEEWE